MTLAAGNVQAAVPGKVKALGTFALYGAGGGALLGLASMAFGGRPRAIAMGASLGLYAGIIFGSYVALSHAYSANRAAEDQQYQGTSGYDEGQRWNPYEAFSDQKLEHFERLRNFSGQFSKPKKIPLYLNIIQYQF